MLLCGCMIAQPKFSSISSSAGSPFRMGFLPRGIAMGNAVQAETEGELCSYYNPALSAFQNGNSFQAGYSALSLDRHLNFLSFTKKFIRKSRLSDSSFIPSAGVSFGMINSGVTSIDGRDADGYKTGDLSTSENQFFFSVSNRFSSRLSFGLAVKFYHYSLYQDVSSSALGFDLGAIYSATGNLSIALVLTDLKSKYKWDSSKLYGQDGTNTEDEFPVLRTIALSYKPVGNLDLCLALQNTSTADDYLRLGAEFSPLKNLFLRAGLDRLSLNNSDLPPRGSLGLGYSVESGFALIGFNYSFQYEPYSSSSFHLIGLGLNF